jgi:Coenzyme F420-reducing hydrogenase, beta subunit
MLEIQKKRKCTGCGACSNVCPTAAITMRADSEGFSYPLIDDGKCIDCKKCKNVCPTRKENQAEWSLASKKESYLCYINDEQARLASSSGGIFYALAMACIRSGGVVFGVKFDKEWKAVHAEALDAAEVARFQVSKYVQSDIGDTYKKAKAYLEEGKKVLFSGAPCQIAGLKKFLGRDYENLTTCDFICHGVPSPGVWQSYVKYREEQAGAKAMQVQFRDKTEGWLNSFFFSFLFHNKEKYRKYKTKDIYYKGFLNNLFVRPCCHKCSFKGFRRAADITIADAWGIQTYAPEFYDEKGVSVIISHTDRGADAYDAIQGAMTSRHIDVEKPIQYNANFHHSEMCSLHRKKFFADWKARGIEIAVESNLKFYDKLFRKGVSILKRMPIYIKRFRTRKS